MKFDKNICIVNQSQIQTHHNNRDKSRPQNVNIIENQITQITILTILITTQATSDDSSVPKVSSKRETNLDLANFARITVATKVAIQRIIFIKNSLSINP
jgi:hypothetical protein